MELTNEQWNRIEPIVLSTKPSKDPRGRKGHDPRKVLNGILWILRPDAPWKRLPPQYPPYQNCHRRFQKWAKSGVFRRIVQELAEGLSERGGIDTREAFIDGTFVPAKKGSCCRQDKARQGHQDHGHRRHCWSSCRRSH